MTLAILLTPLIGGLLAFALPSDRPQRAILIIATALHLALVIAMAIIGPEPMLSGYLYPDALGLVFLPLISLVFFVGAIYAVGYLGREVMGPRADWVEGALFSNLPERVFVGCLLFFLTAMTLVTLTQHLAFMWVGIEAATLSSAPLIYFHRHHRSLEATWKFLLISSVGIALALLGTFFLAVSATIQGGQSPSLFVGDMVAIADTLDPTWLKAAFILLLCGYGTKMGLAPFHTWMPDTYSESPSLVSALMSGALLNCAFVGIMRAYQITDAAGQGEFVRDLLIGFGLFSMGVAAVFIIRQTDFKRMLAYSSVEHMGIVILGIGIGGAANFASVLHAINHSLAKGLLFFVAGNVLAVYKTTATRGVRGILNVLPVSGALWVLGFLAVTGSPPFGTFLSEFMILQAALDGGHTLVAVLYLALLALVFVGMGAIVLRMAQGEPWARMVKPARESALAIVPPVVLAAGVLFMGLYIPPAIDAAIWEAAALIGGVH